MQYRKFGETGLEVSALGFGAMRLPTIGDDRGNIDEETARDMIRYAFENGVNYIDTAYNYHSGESEVFVGEVLKELGCREDVYLATKNPVARAEEAEDLERFLEEQLEKLQTDYIDFYLLHGLRASSWEKAEKFDGLSLLDSALEDGRIKYAGFSFHDSLDLFKEIVDSYDWDFCQIQLNFMDQNFQAGLEGMKYAAERGLAVVVMEPLRGGGLTDNIPEEVEEIWQSSPVKRTPAEWGLRWVWNQPEVSVVLSGMSAMEHVKENVATAQDAHPNSLTEKELAVIERVKGAYEELIQVNCTACNYCQPCPEGINIPFLLRLYNDAHAYVPPVRMARMYINRVVADGTPASECVACLECEEACPQDIPVSATMEKLHDFFMQFEDEVADEEE